MDPVNRAIEAMIAEQERRHAWLYAAGEQIRRWREEDKQLESKERGSGQ